MEIIQVTDYDVLADKMPGGRYILDDYRKHIGNTRFSVLLDMYREAYDMVHMRGNTSECEKIVDRIVGVACHRGVSIAVNKGRFLIKQNGEGEWVRLQDAQSTELVHQALRAPTTILEEPVEGEVLASTAFSAMTLGVDIEPSPLPSGGFNDKKRGRRRSLLRRSASESTMLDDKKKLHIRGLGLDTMASVAVLDDDDDHELSPSGLSPIPLSTKRHLVPSGLTRQISAPVITRSSEQIKNWKGMDVVLSASGRMLTSKETVVGNNRLQVMLTLQKPKFMNASPEEQEKIAADLVKAVCQYWGGMILIDQGFTYARLGDDQSTTAMKNLLNPEEAQTIIVSTAPPAKPLLSAPPVPAFLREASLEILTSNGVHTGDPQSMQSQAVKSLQARKAKRTMTKSLGRGQAMPKQDEFE